MRIYRRDLIPRSGLNKLIRINGVQVGRRRVEMSKYSTWLEPDVRHGKAQVCLWSSEHVCVGVWTLIEGCSRRLRLQSQDRGVGS